MTYRRNPDADPIASALGQRTSAKKRASSRENGKLGGGGTHRRYCGPCDAWVKGRECPQCGAETDKPARQTDEREE